MLSALQLAFNLPYDDHSEPGPWMIVIVLTLVIASDFVALMHLRAQTKMAPAAKRKWFLIILLLPFVGAAVYSMSRHKS